MADFVSGFWNGWVMVIVALSLVFLLFVLVSNNTKPEAGPAKLHGHVWDEDIAEYNNPLPRWWLYLFWGTLIFAVVYLALYPGFGNHQGVLGWSSAGQYEAEVREAEDRVGPIYAKFRDMEVPAVAADPEAIAMGGRLFQTYCAQCHGSDAGGSPGFPRLSDNDWLHGGTPEAIKTTITNGRLGVMPPLGAAIGPEGTRDVAHYVRSLSGLAHDSLRAQRGKDVFATNCVACHGPEAKGNQALGAPNLTDGVWLWGSSESTIVDIVNNGRQNRMPGFGEFLGEDKVHVLAAYVWSLSNKAQGQ